MSLCSGVGERLFLRWSEAESGCFAEHKFVGGLVFVGDRTVEDSVLDSVLDEPYLAARREGEGIHDELARDGRLEVADAILLLDVDELLTNDLVVVEVLAYALRVLARDVGFDEEYEVVDIVSRLEEQTAHSGVRHAFIDEGGGTHMQVDELLHVVHLVIKRKAEAAEDLRHHLHADEVVVVEGPAEALVKALGAGLPDVVEERCPEEPEIHLVPRAGGGECLGHVVHDLIGVGEVVLVTDAVARLGALELEELREDELHQSGLLKELEADGWARGEEDLVELRGDALGGDDLDAPCISPDSSEGVGVDEEAELRGEAYGTHHAQRVIAEGDVGIKWRAQGERLHIVQAIEGVDELTEAIGVEADGQSIDREVTALLIFLQRTIFDEGLATIGGVALTAGAYELDLQIALLDLCGAEASED